MDELGCITKVVPAIVPIQGTTNHALTATAVDARGFDRAHFIIATGAMNPTAVMTMKVTQSDASAGTYAVISGAQLTNVANAGASKVYVIDVPVAADKPYLKLRGTSGTARVTAGAVCILYGGSGKRPASAGYTQYVRV